MSTVVNFLGELRTRKGEYISYGAFRMHKACVVNTLRVISTLKEASTDDQLLSSLIDSIQYDSIFNLDDLLAFLVEDFEDNPPSSFASHVKDHRACARKRAIMNLKLHGMFRSDCCLHMERGHLFSKEPGTKGLSGSHWGPMSKLDNGVEVPDWVVLRLSHTKSSGVTEVKIPCCPSEPALCPVHALFTYVNLVKSFPMPYYVTHSSTIWLGFTQSSDGGRKMFKPITSSDPIAKDTRDLMTSAGIDHIYRAHSVRAAVASSHLAKGSDELDIIKCARWSGTSVFRKYYERTQHKQLSVADLVPSKIANANAPASSPSPPSQLSPRLNTIGPRGGAKAIPGMQWFTPAGSKKAIKIHCSSCWEPDDHTMVWCRKCNRHFHGKHLKGTPAEVEQNHQDGWFCSKCLS
jgi:hypothetical protein